MSLVVVAVNLQAVQPGGRIGQVLCLFRDPVLLYNCQLIDQRASFNMVVNQKYLVSKSKREGKTLVQKHPMANRPTAFIIAHQKECCHHDYSYWNENEQAPDLGDLLEVQS